MSKNLKILSNEELYNIIELYDFDFDNKFIYSKPKKYSKITCHDINKSFFISSKIRKITFSKFVIDLWTKKLNNYNLIEVQNAVNFLIVMYQKPTLGEIKNQLNRQKNQLEKIKNKI